MDIKHLTECIQRFINEAQVIDFNAYKNKKLGQTQDNLAVDTNTRERRSTGVITVTINKIVVTGSEGSIKYPWFDGGEELSYEEFQKRIDKYDQVIRYVRDAGYDKVWFRAEVSINGEDDININERVDLGDGRHGRSAIDVRGILYNRLLDADGVTDVNITNSRPAYNLMKVELLLKKKNATGDDEKCQNYLKEALSVSNEQPESNDIPSKDYTKQPTDVEVGDILCASWGYSMTIVDFYRVVKRTKATVWLEQLESRNVSGDGWSGTCVPVNKVKPNKDVDGKPFRINTKPFSFVCKVKSAYLEYWTGKPKAFDRND